MKLVMRRRPLDNMREARQVVAMKKDTLGIGLLLCAAAVVSWLGIMGPLVNDFTKNPYQWFKDFQPLIGATLAGIGLYVAWLNVSRQVAQSREAMLITLIGREEERIEENLPGLERTAHLLSEISFKLKNTPNNEEYKDTLHENGLYLTAPDEMRTMIDDRFQSADAKTRLDLFHIMNLLVFQCDQLYAAKFEKRLIDARIEHQRYSRPFPTEPSIAAAMASDEEAAMTDARLDLAAAEATFRLAVNQFDMFKSGIDQKIVAYRRRLPIFRKRIEASLDKI
jgi:hypothetical protein